MPLIRRDAPGEAGDADAAAKLEDGAPDERRTAARILAGKPAAATRLARALAVETDRRVREAIFTSLMQIGGAEGVAAVLPHLRSDDAALRGGALDVLKAMPGAARGCLPALLGDRDPDVRILGCDLARCIPDDLAVGHLARMLDAETEVNVCAAAIDVLAEIGNVDIASRLIACAARFADQPFLAFAVAVALRRIGAPSPTGHG